MQVADFGSARFATQEGYQHAEQHPPERAGSVRGSLESMMVSPSVFLDAISPLGHTTSSIVALVMSEDWVKL